LAALLLFGQLACSPPPIAPTAPPVPGQPTQLFQPEIRGVVREVDGGPVAGLRLDVTLLDGPSDRTTMTSDAEGRFVVPAQAGSSTVQVRVRPGLWGEKYVWATTDAVVRPSSSPAPVSVELKLQVTARLTEATTLDFKVTDDALSFGQPEVFGCGPCVAFVVKPARLQDFNLHVQASGTGAFRVILVGSKDYDDVNIGGAASQPGASEVVLPVTRTQLETSQYDPVVYIERARGLPPQSFRMTLARVE
jgi:hypothetical protein